MKTRYIAAVLGCCVVFGGCNFGKVDQGRVLQYNKDKKTVTIIRDVSTDPNVPKYEGSPVTYTMPTKPSEIGPEPKPGGRLNLDMVKREITIVNPSTNRIEVLPFTLVDKRDNVDKNDPLVFDATQGKAKKFPIVDREKKTITIYSSRQKLLVTFSVSDEYFSLPESTWDAGDVVRIYFKEEGKARRFMNVTKTDIYKK